MAHQQSGNDAVCQSDRCKICRASSLNAWRGAPRSFHMHTCEKCQGSMLLDREVDMESGMSLLVLVCINCGRRKQAERAPVPLIEVS